MNIRSIDLQVLIPHATEVSKTQHAVNQHSTAQQQDFANHWQQIAQNRQKQVQTLNQTDGGKVAREQEQQEKGRKKKDSQEQRREESIPEARSKANASQHVQSNSILGNTIDIKT